MSKPLLKLIRVSTVAVSLDKLLEGQLNFLSKHFKVIGVSSPSNNNLKEVGQRENVDVKAISMERKISLLKDFCSLVQLVILFKKESPQIVHSITPKAGLLSMIAGYFSGVPIRIHTFTGLIFPSKTGLLQKILIVMDKLLCNCATHIYPEGEGVKNELLKYNITSKPLKVLANGNVNGINTSHFNPKNYTHKQKQALRQQLDIKEQDFVFIFVGRLVRDKGINELVTAFKSLSLGEGFRERLKLLLVGPYEHELDALSKETLEAIDQNPNIITAGFQEDVRPYYAIANALAFPSYREGFPNVVLQAGAMNLPSIVTDINGCNEIIEDGKNGLIIPPKNSDALQQAMFKLMEDQNLFQELKRNARDMITSRYEQKLVWEALLEEYKRLLVNSKQ
ncbi:MAG: glycosyltransferase [Bacteroidetes bacterium]|jgi:glycosyltransferase involved in cell wall biosynthesis|nr:glycosyltransferase [Bacteroidota bacterium]